MKALITGSTGFIGANLVRDLLSRGHEVHCLVRSTSDLWRILEVYKHITVHYCDLKDKECLFSIFAKIKPDWLFHLATSRAPSDDFTTMFEENVLVAGNLLAACLKFPPLRCIVCSSSLEYGHRPFPLEEEMLAEPDCMHGATKLCSTHLFLIAAKRFCLPVVILRVFSVYGPWESPKRLVPTSLLAAIHRYSIQLTPLGICRDYIYVDDVIQALLLSTHTEAALGEVINIGSGVQTSNEYLVNLVGEITGKPITVDSFNYPPSNTDTKHWVANMDKCQRVFCWAPSTTLEEGITTFFDWLNINIHLPQYEAKQ
jgi:nucleoside-diphosphate-sugar epimerase